MKRASTLFLTSVFSIFLLGSCMMCNEPAGTGRYSEGEPKCGFGEDLGAVEEAPVDDYSSNLPPAAERGTIPTEETNIASTQNEEIEEGVKMGTALKKDKQSRKAKFGERRKRVKKAIDAIKQYKESKKRGGGANVILLVILAILLPPLAVGIYEGITGRFWLVLILWLVGWGVGWWLLGPGLAGLASLVSVILALLIVLGAW